MSSQATELQWALRVIDKIEPTVARSSAPKSIGRPKTVHIVDPLCDPRWDKFLASHPRASLFQSSGWLRALALTYGYRPVAYTTSRPGGPLRNAAVFCQIDSWLTGRRLVSLPFSDHCEWLVDSRDKDDERAICGALELAIATEGWRYLEVRPLQAIQIPIWLSRSTVRYTFHALDLRPDLETIFAQLPQEFDSTEDSSRRTGRSGLSRGRVGPTAERFLPPLPRYARAPQVASSTATLVS